tara:strand:+ start:5797 stop:6114 length:318 start_codon:yes stop_codon:yes gene_type:complete
LWNETLLYIYNIKQTAILPNQKKPIKMLNYLNTLISEKNLNIDQIIEVEGAQWGTNFIPLSSVVEFIDAQDANVQNKIKSNLIKIDFYNGDVMHFFTYIAKGMAI